MFDNLTNRQDDQSTNTITPPAPPAGNDDVPAPPPADTTTQSQTSDTTPPNAPAGTTPPAAPVDFTSILDKMSGGLIKDEAGFQAVLPRIKEYDTLKAERDDLAAKMAQAPVFADDEVRIYNDLKRSGATKEQLKTFQKLNEYGNIKEMPDRDALVAQMIMTGTKPSTAELKVDRLFKLDDESLDETERELLNDDMRVASKVAREELEKLYAKVSDVTQIPPEEAQLQAQAKMLTHQAAVKPYVQEIVTALPHLGEFTLAPEKDGQPAVKFTLPIDDAAKADIGNAVQNYFMDGLTPVTEQNTIEAMAYARAEYFRVNAEKLFQQAFEKGVSMTTERLVSKYENRSGIQGQQDAPPVTGANDAAATAAFANRVANRTV